MRVTRRAVLRVLGVPLALVVLGGGLAACGGGDDEPAGPAKELRLGYFPNVTHATAVVGVSQGYFSKRLGKTTLRTQTFNAGPAAMEALFAGDLDATYVGPNPAINAWVKSRGEALRIIAGATSGGASLVVREGITSPDDLRGKHIGSPQLGNTQDVALRAWLKDHGLTPSSASTDGDVSVEPTENATALQLFQSGRLDGAWVPEPWASRLVLEGKGHVLVDERSLWPGGKFVTTHLVVRTEFLNRHPESVRALLEGQVDTNEWIAAHPTEARSTVNSELKKLTGKELPAPVLDRAFDQLTITNDPVAASLKTSAEHAVEVGLLKPLDLKGIYDLGPLRKVLAERKLATVDDAGLGRAGS